MKRVGTMLCGFFLATMARAETSWFAPAHDSQGAQSVIWRPLLSFFLPGFDQYAQGHWRSGVIYSGAALTSAAWYVNRARRLDDAQETMQWDRWTDEQRGDYLNHEELPRQAGLAAQTVTAVGALSAWHSFRSAVETHKPEGRFEFLKEEETPMDLLKAPFQFHYLQRKTTWIPLLMAATVGALSQQSLDEDYSRDPYQASDGFHASAFSYNAGVSEEALFRGYLHPLLYEATDSSLWSNALQSVIFGLAHRATVERPFAQAGMGFYLGWLQERRRWTLSESIFVHTWWDVIALSSSYVTRLRKDERGPPLVIWLPAVSVLL